MLFPGFQDLFKCNYNELLKPFLNCLKLPVISSPVLNPFKIAYRYAASIGKNVRNYCYAFLKKYFVSLYRCGAVCQFHNKLCFYPVSVFLCYLVFQRCRNQYVNVKLKKLLIRDVFMLNVIAYSASAVYSVNHAFFLLYFEYRVRM